MPVCLAACDKQVDWGQGSYPTPEQIALNAQRAVPALDAGALEASSGPPIPRPRAARTPEAVAEKPDPAATPVPAPVDAEAGQAILPTPAAPAVPDAVALALSGPTQRIEIPAPRIPPDPPRAAPPGDTLLERLLANARTAPVVDAAGVGNTGDQRLSALRDAGDYVDAELIRAPELFRASGLARWNGQRTARGVWVAHPKARSSRKVRIVNSQTGAEIDGMLYRPDRAANGDIITVSSDAAAALGLQPDQPALLALFGLRPKGSTSPSERRAVEVSAFNELASHVLRMQDNQLLQFVAATMRGMGYATVFEDGPPGSEQPAIRAFPRPDAGSRLPAIRVLVRAPSKPRMGSNEVAMVHEWLTGSGDLGVVISVPGFTGDAAAGLSRSGPHLEMVDLDGLLNIWLTHYENLTEPDRALLPLQPVYFLAGN